MDDWTRKAVIFWVVALAASTVVMLLLLITGEKSLNSTLIVFLFTVKFLAGFGIVLALTSAGIFFLQKFEDKFRGEENRKKLKAFMTMMVLVPVALLVYYFLKIFQSYAKGGMADNIFDKILFAYGIASLMVTLYVLPLVRDEFATVTTVTTGEMIKKTVKGGVRGFKKRFFSWRKNFAKAQLQDHVSLKEFLELWRQRLAVVALLVLGVGSLVFTPVAVIFIAAWFRVYFFTSRRPFKFEVYLIVAAALAITVVSVLVPFVLEFTPFYAAVQQGYYFLDVAYFVGLALASALYIGRLTRGIYKDWKLKRKTKKLKDLKAEKAELERKLKETEKRAKRQQKAQGKGKAEPQASNAGKRRKREGE
ncbi:MAG: hypothetical protein ACTSU5_08625 [Promethearchaeota archaeon]